MRFRSRRSINGVLASLVFILIALLVLGIVTEKIIFYILMGVVLLFVILSAIGLFVFLKKTAQEGTGPRKSTYDITEGKDYTKENLKAKQESDSAGSKKTQEASFCDYCGMRLETSVKKCSNCGKTSK